MGNMTDFILLLYSSYSYAVLLFCDSFWSLGFQLWGGGGGGDFMIFDYYRSASMWVGLFDTF